MTSGQVPVAAGAGERVVIVGASLAGITAATELRRQGYTGRLTLLGDEQHRPYDRPPQSKTVASGRQEPGREALPQPFDLGIDWRLGVAATGLDRQSRTVRLADGSSLAYDRLLIATGARPRPWHDPRQAALDGVLMVHTREDGAQLRRRLDSGPDRVVIVGAGFTGSELASVCRERGLQVTLLELAGQPLQAAVGQAVGAVIGTRQRNHGVDLRVGLGLAEIVGGAAGKVTAVRLSDGTTLATQLVLVCIGMIRNVEWLAGAGLDVSRDGVRCDGYLRVVDQNGAPDERVFAAGDISACPRPRFENAVVALEHWGNALDQGRHAACCMLGVGPLGAEPEVFDVVPRFWSNQLGWNIKSIGIPNWGDTIVVAQGDLGLQRGVVAYGRNGILCGAVAINAPRELEAYEVLIGTPFPPVLNATDWRGKHVPEPAPARFSAPAATSHEAPATIFDPSRPELARALGVIDPQTLPVGILRSARRMHDAAQEPADEDAMTQTTTIPSDLFTRVMSAEHRADPRELWRQLRQQPVALQDGDVWVVSGYPEVHALMSDPRMSSDYQREAARGKEAQENTLFIFTDPPYHEEVRAKVMRHFGPPACPRKVLSLAGATAEIAKQELDALRGRTRMDVVADFTHGLPVRVICTLLGVPEKDEGRFKEWVPPVTVTFANPYVTAAEAAAAKQGQVAMVEYLADIVRQRQQDPRDDMISDMLTDDSPDGGLTPTQVVRNSVLLFVAGHITTVNATASTILHLLRNPDVLEQVRNNEDLVPATFEEGLRIGGPIHFVPRVALADVPIAGTVIPQGADVRLLLACANLDPRRFPDAETFDPTRPDNQHLAFVGGPHLCFGAPLARMEAQIMLREWIRRVENPRLVVDPPPYGASPGVVGPSELLVDFDAIRD